MRWLLKAIYFRVKDTTIKGDNGKKLYVFSRVAGPVEFPYCTIGDQSTDSDFSSKTWSGQNVTFTVDLWCETYIEASRIADEMTALITTGDLTLENGFRVVHCSRVGSIPIRLADEKIHWVIRFRYLVQDTQTVQE
jgi:hypothetical protein